MSFYTVVWCPSCNGVDFQGCFDGGVERLGPFDTRKEAEAAGIEMTEYQLWRYEIEEVNDGAISR